MGVIRDGLDLTATQFYQKLESTDDHPTTSQPSPGLFVECYQRLLKKVDAIISIHLTEKLSGTVHTAELVSQMFPDAEIQVIDSHSTTMGLGSIVIEAARAVQKGIRFEQLTHSIIAIMHTAAEMEALKLKARIEERFHHAEVIIHQAGPVLGTHVGPGALALIHVPQL